MPSYFFHIIYFYLDECVLEIRSKFFIKMLLSIYSVWQAVIFFILTYPFGAERHLVSESEKEVNGCQGLQRE